MTAIPDDIDAHSSRQARSTAGSLDGASRGAGNVQTTEDAVPPSPSAADSDEPFWNEERRDLVATVLGRLGRAFGLWFASMTLLVLVAFIPAIDFGPDANTMSRAEWRWRLLPAIIVFALSVVPFVESRAPRPMRVIGAIYALAGWWVILDLWGG